MFSHCSHLSAPQVLLVLLSTSTITLQTNLRTAEDYVYDYYNFPQMFDGPAEYQDQTNRAYSDGQSKHVTYLHNGAVISNVPDIIPSVVKQEELQPPKLPSFDHHNKQDDAFVIQNPLLGNNNNNQNQVLDFDATLTGMMGALAEIQKKEDSMLGSIRRQKGILEQLDKQVETAEDRRKKAESEAEKLELTKQE